MDLIIIEGGKKLNGTIDISGSKNASLPMMIASLLTKQTVELNNVPNLSDVKTLKHLLRILGSEIVHNNRLIKIKTEKIIRTLAPYDLVRKMRASFWVLAPLIARFGSAEVSLPGGCAIGIRPINMYLKIMEKMNVSYAVENGYVKAKSKEGLRGSKITLDFQSVGCTHFFLMLAVLAKGDSSLENSACEPEVVALGRMLQKMGAKIEGLGTKRINITGVESLSGLSIQVPSDRIEAGTYAIALAMTGGKLKLNNINTTEIDILIRALESTGVETYSSNDSILLERKNGPILSTNIETAPYPGFPTDLQAQFMALMTLSNGISRIKENIFENRFMHVQELARFGANIELEGDLAIVKGVKCLIAAPVMATDLRASASLIIAALAAKGTTSIRRIYHLDRGFEELEKKLNGCGADIKRIQDE